MKTRVAFLAFVAVFSLFILNVDAFCNRSRPKIDLTPYGAFPYCEYKGIGLRPGSVIYTKDCMRCECFRTGLSCCGQGLKAGVIAGPPGLKAVSVNCKIQWVPDEVGTAGLSEKEPSSEIPSVLVG
ncbi:beta-microseminoprotein [Lingula anatina]|uniref:Beta-microseminoprotein n=1 Tax=Lingula anatina TaxID=7574 RepID=A0A1S3I4I4_LINAN|nr:beta-microseminoprotein [Lingula anatina]|eukprot:XP_013393133.1 beta-microseminoprotein [Lingula anatina]